MTGSWASQLLPPAILTLLVVRYFSWRRKSQRLPPGPPKLPFIDNLHNMPDGLDWVKFAEMSRNHNSDILHLSALGNSIVVLNSYQVAQDLLEQRSGIYSSRAQSTMLNGLSGFDTLFGFDAYGDLWRASRRLFTKHFGLGSTTLNQPREVFYTRRFLGQLVDQPDDFRQHIKDLVGSISVSMTYGVKTRPFNDPNVQVAEEAVTSAAEVAVGTYLVDIIPALKYVPGWLPGFNFQNTAAECKRALVASRDGLFEAAKAALNTGNYTPSFMSEAIQDSEDPEDSDFDRVFLLKNIALQTYLAGADTTASALATFFLLMACHPDVQKKLQQELDDALKGRLPEHADLESLPYLNAVLMEIFRWKTPLPVGVPHSVTLEDVYEGYYIPKDSIVVPNLWSMHHDSRDYPDPFKFNPERFLKDGEIDESIRNPIDITFGFGRRICPGRHIAVSTMKMAIASVLLCFNILKKTDEAGKIIEPSQEYTFSLITHPKDFACEIKPRSAQAQESIAAWIASEGDNPP